MFDTGEGSAMPIWVSLSIAATFWGTLLVLKFIEKRRDKRDN